MFFSVINMHTHVVSVNCPICLELLQVRPVPKSKLFCYNIYDRALFSLIIKPLIMTSVFSGCIQTTLLAFVHLATSLCVQV